MYGVIFLFKYPTAEKPTSTARDGAFDESAVDNIFFAAQTIETTPEMPLPKGVPGAEKFPTPPGLFTIDDLGGWDEVLVKFFDEENGVVTEIERNLGVSTEK